MIYVDTSVVLAHVFAEDRRPRDSFWEADLTSSRLLTIISVGLFAVGLVDLWWR